MHGEVKRSAYLCGMKKDPAYQGLIPYVRSLEDYYGLRVEDYYLLGEGLERELKKLMKQFPEIKEIRNLNDYKKKTGIYIMVLNGYNTLYIGQAEDIRQRIMRHWSRADYFTGTGIDLYKALDTTRIFVLECESKKLNPIENKMTSLCDKNYSFNVLTGGDWDYHLVNDLLLVDVDENSNPINDILSIFAQVNSFADKFIIKEE